MTGFYGFPIIVLDLETASSAEDCRHCGNTQEMHDRYRYEREALRALVCEQFSPIGWDNKPALGLSIGCYYSYQDDRVHWFDVHTLESVIRHLIDWQPLMVSFNGIGFDFPLMRDVVQQQADTLCDAFTLLAANSYDILAEIWRADPARKFERGLNSLDAIAKANGLGAKLSHGAQAPRDWAAGRYAAVLNYCQWDVYMTKSLFEMICAGKPIMRSNGSHLLLPIPKPYTREGC